MINVCIEQMDSSLINHWNDVVTLNVSTLIIHEGALLAFIGESPHVILDGWPHVILEVSTPVILEVSDRGSK